MPKRNDTLTYNRTEPYQSIKVLGISNFHTILECQELSYVRITDTEHSCRVLVKIFERMLFVTDLLPYGLLTIIKYTS